MRRDQSGPAVRGMYNFRFDAVASQSRKSAIEPLELCIRSLGRILFSPREVCKATLDADGRSSRKRAAKVVELLRQQAKSTHASINLDMHVQWIPQATGRRGDGSALCRGTKRERQVAMGSRREFLGRGVTHNQDRRRYS
jgi:hypothetical protein